MMNLLLIEDVEFLGKRGDHVKVKPGYARNFLLPLDKAVHATEDNLRMVDKARVRWLAEEAKLIEELKELAGHIAKLDLKIVAKASEAGHLYGSVTERDIAAAATAEGVAFQEKAVKLEHALKDVGDYSVPIHLHEQVSLEIPVRVRAEGREDWLPGQDEEGEEAEAEVESPEAATDDPTPEA